MSENFKFIESERKGKILVINNYLHYADGKTQTSVYYRCRERSCKARAVFRNNEAKITKEHNHTPNGIEVASREFRKRIIDEAIENPTKSVVEIYKKQRIEINNDGVPGVSREETLLATPTLSNIRACTYNHRNKLLPQEPKTRTQVNVEGDWATTKDNRSFLLANDGNENKIIILGTEAFLRRLCNSDIIFMDGTFYSCPKLFYQLYTMHIYQEKLMIACTYALLPDKTTATYKRMFQLIKDAASKIGLIFNPKKFQIDYEMGMISAINSTFDGNISIKGCLFHFGQSIWRKVQTLGLKNLFYENENFAKLVRRLYALPLVPMNMLDSVWLDIHGDAPNLNDVEQLLSYFVQTYFDENSAMFDRCYWNHYETSGPRTINHLEGWHYALNRVIAHVNPGFYYFINALKKEQQQFEMDLELLRNGKQPKRQDKKYRDLEIKLQKYKDMLQNGTLTAVEYLDRIKYNLSV